MVWGRSLLDAFLDDSKGEFATVRDIYSSFDAYQTHVCLLADRASLGRLTQVLGITLHQCENGRFMRL